MELQAFWERSWEGKKVEEALVVLRARSVIPIHVQSSFTY